MKLTLIAESPNQRPVQKFLASLGADNFLGGPVVGNCGPTYCCCYLKTTIADLKSKVFPSIEDLGWYPKMVSGSSKHSAGYYLCFAPIIGEEVSTGPYVWHVPGRQGQDVAEQVESIKQNGLEPRSFSGRSGPVWNHYPPRIFVFLRPEGSHSGLPNVPIAQIDSAGKTFYHDEQYARGHAAYTIDPIPPEDITWKRQGDKFVGELLPWEDQDISGGWAAEKGFGA